MRKLAILGSTGSIGTSALEVAAAFPDRLEVTALAAGRNRELLREQCRRFRPALVSVGQEADARWLAGELGPEIEVQWGLEGLEACALRSGADTVLASIVGAAGLSSTEAALRAGRRVCVANKESLVVGGGLLRKALAVGGGELLPVDSEHAALHQLLAGRDPASVRELRLTASGGPFREWPLDRIRAATVEEALNHPTWKMGPKITVDSATLMNKGLEVIEASVLFGLGPEQVGVTVHPQSQVHAMVDFRDGSYQLQVCANDMKLPIQYALLFPDCLPGPVPPYDWEQARAWSFEPPDLARFPCLALAFEALRLGGTAPALLNAANEEAVAAFLSRAIGFWDIQALNAEVLARIPPEQAGELAQVLDADRRARACAQDWIRRRAGN
ncbi:MAG: 1-deoxy-D-xylulose-5-phosphate reductoisomerase [Acidobacteria bacterium]|nr:1-deoxy-D-xylulose-5-phosphate reductoisomerase [Acidobacteriota bacterium]